MSISRSQNCNKFGIVLVGDQRVAAVSFRSSRKISGQMGAMFALTAAVLVFGAARPALAADNATATASANIITPLAVTSSQNLAFGNILAGTGGTVTVAPTGARAKSGGVTLLAGTSPTAAQFHVTADTTGGATYTMSYSKTDLAGPGPALALSAITPDVTPTSGSADIKVGATITIASGQTPGTYTGSITATATYN